MPSHYEQKLNRQLRFKTVSCKSIGIIY